MAFVKGNIPWNKGISTPPRHVMPHNEEAKLKCSISQKKRWKMGVYKNRILNYIEIGNKSRDTQLKNTLRGDKHPRWAGGYPKRQTNDSRYRKWRENVFKRDNYTCQYCLERGGFINAHHIKLWHKYPKLRYKISNGLTLCKKCHCKVHNKRS